MTILVTGATGTVGGALIREFHGSDTAVRALARSPERADDLRGYDCEIAIGTYEHPESLDDALRGVTAAFLVSPIGPDQVAQETAFVDAAARAAGRPHVVKVAALGYRDSDVRFGRSHRTIVDALAASGLGYTVLAPSAFQQNLLAAAAAVQEGMLPCTFGEGAVGLIDARDVAAVAARVLTDPAGHAGRSYDLTGPVAITYSQVAEIFAAALDQPLRCTEAPLDEVTKHLQAAGVPDWTVEGLVELWAWYRDGGATTVTDEVRRLTGTPPRRVEDFLADHATPFRTT